MVRLNPYCSGQWTRTQCEPCANMSFMLVLILIVVDNGLVHTRLSSIKLAACGLNPYCSGQWARTRHYKIVLIISKLKNFTKQILTFLNRKLTIP